MTVTMTEEVAKALRTPFDQSVIGKLPRVYCRACRETRGGGSCQHHTKVRCRECGNNITSAHLHLDYVGHAETTDRFLSVDPEWTWEPVAFGPDGLPALDRTGGLWIRLTIAGVTRLGYGHAGDKSGGDAIKEAIGDALRNAGMRFGVALDLWGAKFKDAENAASDGEPAGAGNADQWESATPARREPDPTAGQVDQFDDLAKRIAAAESEDALTAVWPNVKAAFSAERITTKQANELRAALAARRNELVGVAA